MRRTAARAMAGAAGGALRGADATQRALMAERVILVDREDRVLRGASKAAAHLRETGLPLHRAFSVFLFDREHRLLVQQRAETKVTYPGHWANTCCSHPLYNPRERGEPEAADVAAAAAADARRRAEWEAQEAGIEAGGGGGGFRPGAPRREVLRTDPVRGVKRAALRKLGHELGVKEGALREEDLHLMTKVHYRDEMAGGVWGEHEMDYVLVGVVAGLELAPAPNEVRATRWLSSFDLKEFLRASRPDPDGEPPLRIAPWFEQIMNERGWTWWHQLEHTPGLQGVLALREENNIIEIGGCSDCETEFKPTDAHPE